jgi:MFS family permease
VKALDGLVDVRPLRASAPFRRLWLGTTASAFSGQVAVVAVLFQVWELTRDPLWVGAIGLAQGAATIGCGALGGTRADRADRRRVVLLTSAGTVVAAVLLAAQAAAGLGSVVVVLVLVAAQSGCGALGFAARRTFIAGLLPRGLVPAGVALQHLSFQAAMLLGPAAAGVVLGWRGAAAAYLLDAAATLASLYGVFRLPSVRPAGAGGGSGLRATWDGWRFLLGRPALRGALATDLAATVLAMPVALFPVLNQERFGGDPRTLGLFLSALAAGGIVAGLASGLVTRAPRPGLVALLAAGTWGLALAGVGLVAAPAATLALLVVAGAADTVAVISRGTVVQLATPDAYLGRASSAEYVVGAGGPALGDARAGAVAGLGSAEVAAVTGGLACAVAVLAVAVADPALRRWTRPEPARPTGPGP